MSRFLKPGDRVGVVAPGYTVRRQDLLDGIVRLERMGFEVVRGEHVLGRDGYLAGDDGARLSDLRRALLDPELHAVWFARGGYGTARLLDRLPWRRLKQRPKLLVGYSDLTALFAPYVDRVGGRCLYGPVVTELGRRGEYDRATLRDALGGKQIELAFRSRQIVVPGRADGILKGGNLSVLTRLCGTRFMPDLRGALLFLEDIGERTYRIDGMLNQLRLAGALNGVAGVILGGFAIPARTHFPPDRDADEVFREAFEPLGVPVVRDVIAGHVPRKRTLTFGARARIDTARRRIRIAP
ncbi:MAG: LD-carboxypeptidase [bacterium]|nr:LD-carboxypeptidase [bacterium]